MEITLTTSDSEITVLYKGKYFVLEFPFNQQINYKLRQIQGADFGNVEEKKWTVPKNQLKELTKELYGLIIWKTPEEMKQQKEQLEIREESLQEVLDRVPRNLETPYMKIEPYSFQKLGVNWAMTNKGKRGNIKGGLLADLMGLGKTIQALTFSSHLKSEGLAKKCLVICPATLKYQWQGEIEKFTYEKAVVIDGDQKKRHKLFDNIKEEEPFYTIINYELLFQREKLGKEPVGKKTKNGPQKTKTVYGDYIDLSRIKEMGYDVVVIDEAHRMKNPETETAIAIRQINAEYKLLMTGTPIERDLQNIFQLVDYISPNIFSSEDINFETRKKMFEDRFLIMSWNPFTKWERERMVVGVKNVGILKNLISPYMLRRTTEEVSDEMPDMKEHMVIVDWDKDQKSLYEQLKKELISLQEEKGLIKDEEGRQRIENEMNASLLYMLEVCDTPELLLLSDSPLAKRKLGKRKNFAKPPKLKRLVEMCEELLESGEKIVIFSKFERMTRILQRELNELAEQMAKNKKKTKGAKEFGTVMYTGATAKGCKWRDTLEKQGEPSENLACIECPFLSQCDTRTKSQWFFQNDANTKVILATDAANYGVNLQKGKYLINYDLPDSYSIYAQRGGRIQRLGSNHDDVHIYNIAIKGGIDEAKYHKIMKQKELIDQVVEKDEIEEDAVFRATASMETELIKEIMKSKNK